MLNSLFPRSQLQRHLALLRVAALQALSVPVRRLQQRLRSYVTWKGPFWLLKFLFYRDHTLVQMCVNLTEKFAAGARWWRRRWKHLRTILLWKIISRISKALTGVDICVVSCISWAEHVWGWGECCMMVTVSGERSCKSAELGLQQKTNSGFNKVKTLQRHKNDLVSQNGPCLSFWSRSREPFK